MALLKAAKLESYYAKFEELGLDDEEQLITLTEAELEEVSRQVFGPKIGHK